MRTRQFHTTPQEQGAGGAGCFRRRFGVACVAQTRSTAHAGCLCLSSANVRPSQCCSSLCLLCLLCLMRERMERQYNICRCMSSEHASLQTRNPRTLSACSAGSRNGKPSYIGSLRYVGRLAREGGAEGEMKERSKVSRPKVSPTPSPPPFPLYPAPGEIRGAVKAHGLSGRKNPIEKEKKQPNARIKNAYKC